MSDSGDELQPTAVNADGLRNLHARRIIHRNLNSRNVLFNEILFPHISDFRLSRIMIWGDPNCLIMTRKIGTPIHIAPERFRDQHHDHKVDVGVFAALVSEILSLLSPFTHIPSSVALGVQVTCGVRQPRRKAARAPMQGD
jgi:serine/threonine protein kinase